MSHSADEIARLLGSKSGPPARMQAATFVSSGVLSTVGLSSVSEPATGSKQRSRICGLHHSLHCSIIGTCLTTAELRRLLVRLDVQDAGSADEHAVHQLGVVLASRPQAGSKHLQKALDRRHKLAIARFAKVKNPDGVLALWQEAVKSGDIPGAYWAALTHPATTETVVKRVFGEVHMLSHLVGAANRADIRRLRELEEEREELAATIERQQRQLREGFTSRDQTIRSLNDALARKAGEQVSAFETESDIKILTAALADREKRLADEVHRRERLQLRLEKVSAAHDEAERARDFAERDRNALADELASIEHQLAILFPSEEHKTNDSLDLRGQCILYVGGRANQTAHMKNLVERTNGCFLHHDGGLEHKAALLQGLVSRADLAMFPVDCVSHQAAGILKRACRQLGKRYLPLRNSSLTCLLSALAAAQANATATASAARG